MSGGMGASRQVMEAGSSGGVLRITGGGVPSGGVEPPFDQRFTLTNAPASPYYFHVNICESQPNSSAARAANGIATAIHIREHSRLYSLEER